MKVLVGGRVVRGVYPNMDSVKLILGGDREYHSYSMIVQRLTESGIQYELEEDKYYLRPINDKYLALGCNGTKLVVQSFPTVWTDSLMQLHAAKLEHIHFIKEKVLG